MATISLTGKVVGKAGTPAVSMREINGKNGSTIKIASFSVNDREYAYFKNKEDNPGQFYRVEVTGPAADIANERLELGSWVSVTGQAVWRQYNGEKYFDVKNARIVPVQDRNTASAPSSDPF